MKIQIGLIALLNCLLITVGSGAEVAGGDTPEAVFETMRVARIKQDWPAVAATFSPDSQVEILGGMFNLYMLQGSSGKSQPELESIMKKHSILPAKEGAKKSDAAVDPLKDIEASIRKVKDKTAAVAEFLAALFKNAPSESADEMKNAKLGELKIDGDKATAKMIVTLEGRETSQDIRFIKIEGKWYNDQTRERKAATSK